MRHLVVSVDYEVFGNGSGDVSRHVVEPTKRMARICERLGVPLTVFFEAEEYLAFEANAKPLQQSLGYSPAELMREQARALARQGHDVQLHLHPEWHGARWKDGQWSLTSRCAVDELFETASEVSRYLAERTEVLQGMTGKRVVAYRAGAFSAQPGTKLLAGLAQARLLIDSSVVKGLTRQRPSGLVSQPQGKAEKAVDLVFDYRKAPSAKGPWRVKDDVSRVDPTGPIWEFPIYSVMGRRFHQLKWRRLRAKFSRNVPKDRQLQMMNQLGLRRRNPWQMLRFLCQPIPIKLDFHNLSPGELMRLIRTAPPPSEGQLDVLVLIGHTKEHVDDKSFEEFLKRVSCDSSLRVVGFNQVAELLPTAISGQSGRYAEIPLEETG
jgi:hypothetical protein